MTSDPRADLQQDIEQTREHLGETVDLLGEKFDVKKQATQHRKELMIAGSVVAGVVVAVMCLRRLRS
ncbi:hypothetical protein ASG90_12705 [Nocardioides sp. Soil797]|nr:hypothetical protein ASG90_12705 [Nocardioides sp. Soil797]